MELLTKLFELLVNLLGVSAKEKQELPEIEEGEETTFSVSTTTIKNIICNHEYFPIEWDKVHTFDDPGGITTPETNYKTMNPSKRRKPKLFTVHWDGCLDTKSCAEILENRGLSVHFCIDNDGTIYQLLDTQHVAWHAKGVNSRSVGVEISNACNLKYKSHYDPPRPIVKGAVIHKKKLKPFMGFYPVQIAALKALTKALHQAYDIPLECPLDDGKLVNTVSYDVIRNKFSGVIGHYHVSHNKTDPAGLDIPKMLQEIKEDIKK